MIALHDTAPAGWQSETRIAMDTFVRILVAGEDDAAGPALSRAFAWFEVVERACSRFDPESELSRLSRQTGTPLPVTPLLFELLRFALDLARLSYGAFDPAVGQAMATAGFNGNYQTGEIVGARPDAGRATYRDVALDARRQEVTLLKPMTLDLNAIAKGFAIDLAARELAGLQAGAIDAGGDLYYWGRNPDGAAWRVGIQDPSDTSQVLATLAVASGAVCTSSGSERQTAAGHHLLDARSGAPADELASVTVLAPTAMAADGLATAAFVLGKRRGKRLLFNQQVRGVLVTPDHEILPIPASLELTR